MKSERTCQRCGQPTVFVSGICRYCQTPAERRSKASEGGTIPEMWLCGRAQARQREGLTFLAARAQAVADWYEQARLEAQFNAERGR